MATAERQNVLTESLILGVSLLALSNADGTIMDATGGAGKFSKSAGGFGSGTIVVQGEQASGVTKTGDLMFTIPLPDNFQKTAYLTGIKALVLKLRHRTSPIANTSSSIGAEAYKSDGEGGTVGSDLVTTPAVAANTDTFTEREFTITPTSLEPGDDLVILVRAIVDDSAGATNARAEIGKIEIQYDGKM